MVQQIRVESAYLPPVIINDPFGPGAPSPASAAVLGVLRPKVSVILSGGQVISRAPWGDPGASKWPAIKLLLAGAAALAIVAIAAKLRG
jgi:hypothetical protein